MKATPWVSCALIFWIMGCDDGNTSQVSADYKTVRVQELEFSDSRGKTLLRLRAEAQSDGLRLVVRDGHGSVLQTFDVAPQ